MLKNDENINRFKHKIMEDVCRLEWEGKNDSEHIEQLILDTIPGPKAKYRCCIYKEREIVRQRINLAMAKNPTYNPDSTISFRL